MITQPAITADDFLSLEPFDSFRTCSEISLCIIDDEAILFDARDRKLYTANTMAAFIWCYLEDGLKLLDIISKIVTTFHVPLIEADHHLLSALKSWIRLDLITDRNSAEEVTAETADTGFASSLRIEPASSSITNSFKPVLECSYRLLDTNFRLRFDSVDTYRAMELNLRPFAALFTDRDTSQEVIDVIGRGNTSALIHDGRILEKWAARDEIVPLARLALITLALERSRDFGAVHAATVRLKSDSRCLLLPGRSGVGKSTLTAALIGDGFEALGDDTVVLSQKSLEVRPIPFGVCLKDGAWDLLASRFPKLATYPIHHRPDGKRVRYLMPEMIASLTDAQARHTVNWMIFPERNGTGEAHLVPVRRPDALSRFVFQFCPLGTGWDSQKIDRLAQWIGTIECFELHFSTLDQGVRKLRELCA